MSKEYREQSIIFFCFKTKIKAKVNTPQYINIPVKVIEVTRAIGNKKMKIDSKTSNVLIKINGETKLVPQNISILELLEIHEINKDRVVIELNNKILKKHTFGTTSVKENDELEIVTFVGGG